MITERENKILELETDEIKENLDLMARLYINMSSKNIIEFTREFLDRCYLQNIPVVYKFFSSDYHLSM